MFQAWRRGVTHLSFSLLHQAVSSQQAETPSLEGRFPWGAAPLSPSVFLEQGEAFWGCCSGPSTPAQHRSCPTTPKNQVCQVTQGKASIRCAPLVPHRDPAPSWCLSPRPASPLLPPAPLLPLFCTHLFSVTLFFLLNEDNQRYHPWPAPCLGRQPEAKGQELNKASAKRVRQGQKSVPWVLSVKLSFRNYSKSSALFAAQTWLLCMPIRFAGVVLIPENIPGDSP